MFVCTGKLVNKSWKRLNKNGPQHENGQAISEHRSKKIQRGGTLPLQ